MEIRQLGGRDRTEPGVQEGGDKECQVQEYPRVGRGPVGCTQGMFRG